MPYPSLLSPCWILSAEDVCRLGDRMEMHDSRDGYSLFRYVARLWAYNPQAVPPVPWRADTPCVVAQCRGCGLLLGGGEHFETLLDALEAAEEAGWQGDLCPGCTRNSVRIVDADVDRG